MLNSRKTLAGFAVALAIGGASSSARTQDPLARENAVPLARDIASAAASAELPAGDGAAARVQRALQGVVISAGAEPAVVLIAVDEVMAACRPQSGRAEPTWTCPVTAEAYMALAGLRGIVVAQLEQVDPAAFDTPGTAAFGTFQSTAPSANYSRP